MTIPRVCVACFGGVLALVALCYGILQGSANAWRLFVTLVPPLIVCIWWMVDRAALERRIRRLEARSEIADERRVTAQTDLTEVEHKLHEIEGRVVDVENLSTPVDELQGKMEPHERGNRTGPMQLTYVNRATTAGLSVNSQ